MFRILLFPWTNTRAVITNLVVLRVRSIRSAAVLLSRSRVRLSRRRSQLLRFLRCRGVQARFVLILLMIRRMVSRGLMRLILPLVSRFLIRGKRRVLVLFSRRTSRRFRCRGVSVSG